MNDFPFAVEADIAKRAAGLGGILRCEECGGERPADDVAGYLRNGWPRHCGTTMTYVTLKLLAAESRGEVPEGYELVAVPDDDWRVEAGIPCRRQGARSKVCGKPSVASLNRPRRLRATDYRPERLADSYWSYCIDHLYGRWIENGQVMHWVLRERGEAP